MKNYFYILSIFILTVLSGCNGKKSVDNEEVETISFEDHVPLAEITPIDTVKKDTIPVAKVEDISEALNFMKNSEHSDEYLSGIIPTIARRSMDYARKLLNNKYDGFIVVDKSRMKVILYDRFGQVQKSYGMACAKNYGTKHQKADSRTPEGFFSVQGIYDSTDWLFTDDDGVTSKKKGQFGPRFIRLLIPGTTQIGIHGTCAPWSIGGRSSHGCIRVTNENILELVELVEPGMPVIIIPGKKDIAVNIEEGEDIVWFPTKDGMSDIAKKAAQEAEMKATEETEPNDTINVIEHIETGDSIRPEPTENIMEDSPIKNQTEEEVY